MRRVLKRTAWLFAILLVALLVGRNVWIKHAARAVVKSALGVDLEMAGLDVGLFQSRIRIEGLTVHNPPGFGNDPLALIPLIDVDYALGSLFSGTPHCTAIELDVHELVVVKNAQGEINLNRLKAVMEAGHEKRNAPAQEPSKPREIQIDRLTLTVDQVRYITLARDGTPTVKTFPIGLDHEVFENLKRPEDVVTVLVWRVLKASGLQGIGVAVDQLRRGLAQIGVQGMDAIEGAVKAAPVKLKEGAQGLLDALKNLGH